MNQLETLLNSLIKMGWKPWGKLEANDDIETNYYHSFCIITSPYKIATVSSLGLPAHEGFLFSAFCNAYSIRILVSDILPCHIHPLEYELNYSSNEDYQYRLLESALVPEEELGKFLVDNIKVEGKKE